MRKSIFLLLLPALYGADTPPPPPCATPQACWTLLEQGNLNWWGANGRRLLHPNQTPTRRAAVARDQLPFAVVLSCSDSRIPPEVIFDRGVGDLFVIRVAGNVLDDFATGSIQYAVEEKRYTKLIVVLGHQRCGALEAAVAGARFENPLMKLLDALQPAVIEARNWRNGDLVDNAIDANIHLMANKLEERFRSVSGLVVKRKRYVMDTGLLNEPRWRP
jgi:carbonic anhydrase